MEEEKTMQMPSTKMSWRDFCAKLDEVFGIVNIYYSHYREMGRDPEADSQLVKLVYRKSDHKHLGSWTKGQGWIF